MAFVNKNKEEDRILYQDSVSQRYFSKCTDI